MKAFFDHVRRKVFGGLLTAEQVSGLDDLLADTAKLPITHRAYLLATTAWETGRAMQPKIENLTYTSASRIAKVWPSRFANLAEAAPYVRNPKALAIRVYGGRMGNRSGTEDGWTFRGRGLSQITGRDNYARLGKLLGIDLVGDPDRALDARIARQILIRGATEGIFTGVKLSDCTSYVDMRRVINGTESAAAIASMAHDFEAALRLVEVAPPRPDVEPPIAPPAADPVRADRGVILAVLSVIAAAVAGYFGEIWK